MTSIITKKNIISAAEAIHKIYDEHHATLQHNNGEHHGGVAGAQEPSALNAASTESGIRQAQDGNAQDGAPNAQEGGTQNAASNAQNTDDNPGAPNPTFTPEVGIVLGSGLQNFGEHIKDPVIIPYTEVPHIVKSTVKEHKGRFILGTVQGNATCTAQGKPQVNATDAAQDSATGKPQASAQDKPQPNAQDKQVICMQGRLHPYEGHTADEVTFPIYVMKELGIKTLIVTNAAGGIDTSFGIGDIMLIKDQINLTGMSPCIGITDKNVGPRFFDMTQTYHPKLQKIAKEAAKRCDIKLQEGIYIGDLGPNFETPAEICAYRTLGAAAVGMSTVLEAIAAASQNLPVLGLSLISNPAAGVCKEPLQMDDVYKAALIAADKMEKLLTDIIEHL